MYKSKVDKKKLYVQTKLGNLVALTLAAMMVDDIKKELKENTK